MFARIEVALKPEFADAHANRLLRRMEMTDPQLRKMVRWARTLDVFWMEVPFSREELIYATTEVLWDPVLQWLFTGNLIPSAGGKKGGVEDLIETAPNRPGKFTAIEKRFRLGVTDHASKTLHESFEVVLKKKLPEARIASGTLLVLEGPALDEATLSRIAREFFSNELLESWTLVTEKEISHSERFHPERVKREMHKAALPRFRTAVERHDFEKLTQEESSALMRRKGLKLSEDDLSKVNLLGRPVTDPELEVLSRVWGDRKGSRWLRSPMDASTSAATELGHEIPARVGNLIEETFAIAGRTGKSVKPSWLISPFQDEEPGVVAFDDEDALAIRADIESKAVAADAVFGSMMGVSKAHQKSMVACRGGKPVLCTDLIYAAEPGSAIGLPGMRHPRRTLDGIREGISCGGAELGVPTVGGLIELESRADASPVLHLSSVSILPRSTVHKTADEGAQVLNRVIMVGGKAGKDAVPGAPSVQIVDTLSQKRLMDFILEARELGVTERAVEIAEGGLAWAAYRLSRFTNGIRLHLDEVPLKVPGMKASEILGSESMERILVVLREPNLPTALALATARGLDARAIGSLTDSGKLEAHFDGDKVVDLDLDFIREGDQGESIQAKWMGPEASKSREFGDFTKEGVEVLLRLLSHPNVCSREWMIRSLDHEVQGMSAIKPLHTAISSGDASQSGPNDGAVIKPKPQSNVGIAIATGSQPRLAAVDPYLMGQMAVDEAVRNALAVGADFGREDSFFGLTYQMSWSDDAMKSDLAGVIARASFGAKSAAEGLEIPFISGTDRAVSGSPGGKFRFAIQSLAKVTKIGGARSSDFKSAGDAIYLLGPGKFGLQGSQLAEMYGCPPDSVRPETDWDQARKLYAWLGMGTGKEQKKLRSIHDISDGGLLAAVSECLIARGFGAQLQIPDLSRTGQWEFLLGEGFHSFIVSIADVDVPMVEAELNSLDIQFNRLGVVHGGGVLQVRRGQNPVMAIETKVLRQAWKKEGYWE